MAKMTFGAKVRAATLTSMLFGEYARSCDAMYAILFTQQQTPKRVLHSAKATGTAGYVKCGCQTGSSRQKNGQLSASGQEQFAIGWMVRMIENEEKHPAIDVESSQE
jgi:hypothetical protein